MKTVLILTIFALAIFESKAQSAITGANDVCPNSILTYNVEGQLAGCGSKKFTVTGGIFPDYSNQTTVTTAVNSIKVKWNGENGNITVEGTGQSPCNGYVASKDVIKFSIPGVSEILPFPSIPCGSTSNFEIFVLINLPPSGLIISTAPNGPQSFNLPSGFEIVSTSPAGTAKNYLNEDCNRHRVTIKPTSPSSAGTGTVKNYFNCGSGGELYSPPQSFTIQRSPPAVPFISTSSPVIRCDANPVGIACNTVSGATEYQWEARDGVQIASGNGTNNITITATYSGDVRVKSKSASCNSESNWSNWFRVHFGSPYINAAMTGSCSGYTLWLNEFAATSYNWYEDPGTANNGYLSTYGGGQASGTPTSGEYIVIGQATNQCGNAGYTFLMYACNGYRVAPNPAKAKINVVFDNTDNIKTLPEQIDVLSENSTNVLRTINVKQVFDKKQFINGNTVMIDAEGLPRGTYYLHVKFGEQTDKKTKIDKLRIILE